MAQWVRTLAVKPDNPTAVPEARRAEEGNGLLDVASDIHTHCSLRAPPCECFHYKDRKMRTDQNLAPSELPPRPRALFTVMRSTSNKFPLLGSIADKQLPSLKSSLN